MYRQDSGKVHDHDTKTRVEFYSGFPGFRQGEGPGYHSSAVSNFLYDRRNDEITEVSSPSVGAVNLENSRESTMCED